MISRLTALGIGALAMYFFDPVSGRRRRALVRDKMTHYHREATDYAESTAKDLRNRAQGLVAETQKRVARKGATTTSKVDIDLSQPQ
jgi:gas vesicle protein